MDSNELREFYELLQIYRHSPIVPQTQVAAAYEALIKFVDGLVAKEKANEGSKRVRRRARKASPAKLR
jgi:hypothetical protein